MTRWVLSELDAKCHCGGQSVVDRSNVVWIRFHGESTTCMEPRATQYARKILAETRGSLASKDRVSLQCPSRPIDLNSEYFLINPSGGKKSTAGVLQRLAALEVIVID